LNHAYPVKHKLKDYGMMKIFMISGSLSWDKEPEEDPGGRGMTLSPRQDLAMMAYDGRPLP
jgi:hypothetical protein